MSNSIDPKSLALDRQTIISSREGTSTETSRGPRRFIKGPIPLKWITEAAKLPGKALHVGLVIWFLAGLRKSQHVKFSYKSALLFGIDRFAAYRALQELEKAGLVSVVRGQGRSPIVTLLRDSLEFLSDSAHRESSGVSNSLRRVRNPRGGSK